MKGITIKPKRIQNPQELYSLVLESILHSFKDWEENQFKSGFPDLHQHSFSFKGI